MKIEEVLQQSKPFTSEYQRVMINVIYTSNHLRGSLKGFFKPYGLTPKQYNVLRILKGAKEPKSTSYIKDRLIDKMSDASRIVDRLYQKRLIEKKVCSMDRRLKDVTINENGINLLDRISRDASQLDSISNNLTPKEADQLSSLLDKLRGSTY